MRRTSDCGDGGLICGEPLGGRVSLLVAERSEWNQRLAQRVVAVDAEHLGFDEAEEFLQHLCFDGGDGSLSGEHKHFVPQPDASHTIYGMHP